MSLDIENCKNIYERIVRIDLLETKTEARRIKINIERDKTRMCAALWPVSHLQ